MSFVRHIQRSRYLAPVSVRENGVIVVHGQIADRYGISEQSFISLWYDASSQKIGLQPHSEYIRGCATVSRHDDRAYCISARSYCGVNSIAAGKYTVEYDRAANLIVCTRQEPTS